MKKAILLAPIFACMIATQVFAEQVVFSEVHYNPKGDKPEWVEIFNNTSTPLDMGQWTLTGGIDFKFPPFDEGDPQAVFLKHFERIIATSATEAAFRAAYPATPASTRVFGPWTGRLNNNGERITLKNKFGVVMVSLAYGDDGRWPVAPDGAGHTLTIKSPYQLTDDWRNWKASGTQDGTPGSAPAGDSGIAIENPQIDLRGETPYIDLGSTYRVDDSNTDLIGTNWATLDFDDGAWKSGPGLFGRESKAMPEPGIQTALARDSAGGLVTYYLRTEFDFNLSPAGSRITIDAILDDGARFFLNGQEIGRLRLPVGEVTHTTTAEKISEEGVVEEGIISVDGTGVLVPGRNVFAVEVHNDSAGSSDVVFGARVKISAPSSSVVINEVLPAAAGEGFVEWYNPLDTEVNLRNHYVTDNPEILTQFKIEDDFIVPAKGLASIGFSESGLTPNTNTVVILTDPDGATVMNAVVLSMALNGSSAGRKPSGGTSWFIFSDPTRDGSNVGPGDVANLLSLSEVHVNNANEVDWVELYSKNTTPLPLDGLFVSGSRDLMDKVPLAGSVPGKGYRSFDARFPLVDDDVTLYVVTASDTILGAKRFQRRNGETVFQSFPAGSGEWYGGETPSKDAANAPVRQTSIVINEIMYDPPSDQTSGEFIELYNRGVVPVDLSGWRFTEGVSFEFPQGTTLAAGAYLAVAANQQWLKSVFPGVTVIGNFEGTLRDSGEMLRLEDARDNLVDEVDFMPSGDWPEMADGDGSSMELRHPDMDNNSPTAWADSDESQKATMQSFTYTDPFERAKWSPLTRNQELHIFLVGDAHLILENISLNHNGAGANLLENSAVMSPDESSGDGWVAQGTHWASYFEGASLHLVSDGHGDNKANHAEVDIEAPDRDESYTLTFDGRWVSGKPRLIMETLDHGYGTTFRFPIPENLGTPGAPNSRLLASAAPAVSSVLHSPAVPKSSDPVTITAHVSSSAALESVEVVHRLDSSTGDGPWLRTAMQDNGSGGDEVAGDGVYTATLTQYQADENIVEFFVEAAAAGGGSTMMPKLGGERPALYVVDDRTMPDSLLQERFVVSEYAIQALGSQGGRERYNYKFPRMSNHYFNATFIINESMVFYNAEIRKSGSPFTRDGGNNLPHGKWKLPEDRLYRGRRRSVFDASGTSEGNGTPRFYDDRIARYFLNQMGHPINENEFVHWVVNTDRFKLRENHETISNDFLNRNWNDGTEGTLLRIDDEWRFTSDDGNARSSRNADWSYKDSENPVRYHSEWLLRSQETDYDFTSFIEFVRTLDGDFDEATINRMANRDLICVNAAVRGYDADWDTITLRRGKNAYFYRPKDDGRWLLIHWDGDRVFGGNEPILGNFKGVREYFREPYIRRVFNYYLNELIRKHTKDSARTAAWMEAEEAAIGDSGIRITISHYNNWFRSREGAAESFIRAPFDEDFAIATSDSETTSDTLTLEGSSPSRVYTLRVVDHPEAVITWDGLTDWKLEGIALMSGQNVLTVQGVTHEGEVLETKEYTITKTTNAPPVVALSTDPRSLNVSVSEALILDASSSYDPEGGALTFAWITSDGVRAFEPEANGRATATFSEPGLYTFTVTATDPEGNTAEMTRQAAVYGRDGFTSFSEIALGDVWSLEDVELRDNFSPESYYSLQFRPGKLTLQIWDNSAKPLGFPQEPLPAPETYVTLGDTWKYDDSGQDLGTDFAAADFNDAAWKSGPGLFGFESRALPDPGLQTTGDDFARGSVTYYLRTEFQFDKEPLGSEISIDHILDDGARFFLNGQELGRTRLPDGSIDASTVATKVPDEGVVEESAIRADGSSALVSGTNVLAADLHNERASSSDLVFGANLHIAARPVAVGGNTTLDATIHPWIHRELPATGDWVLQTDARLETLQFGDFLVGLLVETAVNNLPSRYAIGLEDGNKLSVFRVNTSGTTGSVASVPYSEARDAEIRIRREGNKLFFEWNEDDTWMELHQLDLAAGTVAVKGGPFASTEARVSLQASFDYTMLINPTSTLSPLRDQLVVTEFMYNPTGGSDLEFIELKNVSGTAVNLNGSRFLDGEPFGEFIFANTTLAAGAYGLLVNDRAAFTQRYGAGIAGKIVGEWSGGNLGNGGETITLVDGTGAIIHSFTYDDRAPWPEAADGSGASLELIDPQSAPDHGNPSNWQASSQAGGSPGGESQSPDPGFLAFALGADLVGAAPESLTGVGTALNGGQEVVTFSYLRRSDAPGIIYTVEVSKDLKTWVSVGKVEDAGETDNGNGTKTVTVRSTFNVNEEPTYFLRLKVEKAP
jgi:hypothetical protein